MLQSDPFPPVKGRKAIIERLCVSLGALGFSTEVSGDGCRASTSLQSLFTLKSVTICLGLSWPWQNANWLSLGIAL